MYLYCFPVNSCSKINVYYCLNREKKKHEKFYYKNVNSDLECLLNKENLLE